MATKLLDVKGLNCPSPIIQAKKAMNALQPGDTLEILSTDPGAVKDFDTFCLATGGQIMESGEEEGVFRFLIQKA